MVLMLLCIAPAPNLTTRALPLHARFDKSFSLLFTGDGEVALNFEHSWGVGSLGPS